MMSFLARQSIPMPQAPSPISYYSILGVTVSVASDVDVAMRYIDDTYARFRTPSSSAAMSIAFHLQQLDGERGYIVRDSRGYMEQWSALQDAMRDLLDLLVHHVLAALQSQGKYAIHAGAVVHRGGAVIIVGRSGHGKTTLVLALMRRGLRFLSDEFAVVEPVRQQILPYYRSLHIRPGTPALISELRFVEESPGYEFSDGIEWVLKIKDLEQVFPECLSSAVPLRCVLLLQDGRIPDGLPSITPIQPAVAVLEILRSTWATSVDFGGSLRGISQMLGRLPCARLQPGHLESTVDCIMTWLESHRG